MLIILFISVQVRMRGIKMMNERFKKALKVGGKELILANVGFIIISYIIGFLVMGKDIAVFMNGSTGMGSFKCY